VAAAAISLLALNLGMPLVRQARSTAEIEAPDPLV
jgi:hypothetical protein